jgi:MipA family protein
MHEESMRTSLTVSAALVSSFVMTALMPRDALAQSSFGSRLGQAQEAMSLSIGLGLSYGPVYEGARESSAGVLPQFDASLQTESLGTFVAGVGVGGLAWIPIGNAVYSLGTLISYDGGRDDDEDGRGLSRGSKRLRGLGRIEGTVVYGLVGTLALGPGSLSAVGLKAPSSKGHGGALGTLTYDWPFKLGDVAFSLAPSVSFADRRYMQSYFGVTAAQSLRSGLRAYRAEGGLKSYGLGLSADLPLDRQWTLFGSASVERLAGDAADSPIVERRVQPSLAIGVAYTF